MNPNRNKTQSEKHLRKHRQSKQKRPYIVPEKCSIQPEKVFDHFYTLHPQSAVFSVLPGFSHDQGSSSIQDVSLVDPDPNLPYLLVELYDKKHASLSGNELRLLVSSTFENLKVSQEEANF